MAKRKARSSSYQKPSYGKIRDPKKPMWMRIMFMLALILASAIALLAIIGMVIKYIRLVSK